MRRLFAFLVLSGLAGLAVWLFVEASGPELLPEGSSLPLLSIRPSGDTPPADLAQPRGRALVVVVFHTTCPACRDELRALEAEAERLDDLDVEFVLLSDEATTVLAPFAASWPALATSPRVTFATADPEAMAAAFPSPGTPAHYVFDRNGRLVLKAIGQRTLAALVKNITPKVGVPEAPLPGAED